MNQIVMEERESFDSKMNNIYHTNELLDQLEKKMNSYFHQNKATEEIEDKGYHRTLPPNQFYPEPESKFIKTQADRKAKKNGQFKLFAKNKAKQQLLAHSQIPKQSEESEADNFLIYSNTPNLNLKTSNSMPQKEDLLLSELHKNHMIREMETVEILMKEKLLSKERKFKQLEQEILTENEDRVYLYKINVRLENELKFITESESEGQGQSLEWEIKKVEEEVEKVEKKIEKRKAERKQLRKQEQVLREGYQALLNNRRNMTKKDLQIFAAEENQIKDEKMLKGLMNELDRLKGVVESRIKSSGKRKVVKSFKN